MSACETARGLMMPGACPEGWGHKHKSWLCSIVSSCFFCWQSAFCLFGRRDAHRVTIPGGFVIISRTLLLVSSPNHFETIPSAWLSSTIHGSSHRLSRNTELQPWKAVFECMPSVLLAGCLQKLGHVWPFSTCRTAARWFDSEIVMKAYAGEPGDDSSYLMAFIVHIRNWFEIMLEHPDSTLALEF